MVKQNRVTVNDANDSPLQFTIKNQIENQFLTENFGSPPLKHVINGVL